MLKRAVLALAVLLPQVASAADLDYPRRYHRHHARVHAWREQNHVVTCTTSNLVLFSFSNCGQGFDPLSVAGN